MRETSDRLRKKTIDFLSLDVATVSNKFLSLLLKSLLEIANLLGWEKAGILKNKKIRGKSMEKNTQKLYDL